MALTLGSARSEVLRVVNNTNRVTEGTLWIQETIREIAARNPRLYHLVTDKVKDFAQTMSLTQPTVSGVTTAVVNEIIEPVFLSTSETTTWTDWTVPSTPWVWENTYMLESHKGDFQLSAARGLEFHSRWTVGKIWLRYFRKMNIPTLDADVIDLPDDFVYRLIVYGAARHGLIGEDDYDRYNVAEAQYQEAFRQLIEWSNRAGDANRINVQKARGLYDSNPSTLWPFPSNYSL